ncbi:MAG: STAS domain-containing protein [Terriglobales bacterium]
MYTKGPVIVMELPETLKQSGVSELLSDLQPLLETDRPRIVLDCSKVEHVDSAGVEMLIHCLQEAMKHDGDLKLAAVSPASAMILEMMRVDRLFEVFETPEQAAQSFNAPTPAVSTENQPWYSAAFRASELKAAS